MDTSIDFAYPSWDVTCSFDEDEIRDIVSKGSLEDCHKDVLFAALKHIHDHCL